MQLNDVYKCDICGNIIEVIHVGVEALVCCEQPMAKLTAKAADEGKEKHVPVIEKTATGYEVKIGSIPHPMEEKHYIEWIELIADEVVYRQYLKPGDEPKALFCIDEAKEISAREFCNIHGLWSNKL